MHLTLKIRNVLYYLKNSEISESFMKYDTMIMNRLYDDIQDTMIFKKINIHNILLSLSFMA